MRMRAWRGRWRAVAALAACALAAGVLLPGPAWHAARRRLPGVTPRALAHQLADFSIHPLAGRAPWRLLEEHSEWQQWRYRAALACGPRCAAEAAVAASAAGDDHRVTIHITECWRAPLLNFLQICEYSEAEWAVAAAAGGCELRVAARARCALWRALAGRCGAELRRSLDALLARALLAADT